MILKISDERYPMVDIGCWGFNRIFSVLYIRLWIFVFGIFSIGISSCGLYSFTGAAIEGKTINIHFIENTASQVAPSLSPTFTQKLRNRILSQSSLAQLDKETTDYDISGNITGYDITVPSITGTETSSLNRLTISVNIDFKNKLNVKANFVQSFSRFADFPTSQNLQTVESKLIADISDQLADDIFNKCFVNW
jgi:hypothetical protein